MLAKRIIPCLDVTGGRVVKGVNFVELRDAGDPVEIAARYNEQGADELTFLDITAGKCLEVSLRDALDLLQKRFDALGPEAVADASEVLRKAELALAELARGRGPTPGP